MRFFILTAAFTLANVVVAFTPSRLPILRDAALSDVVRPAYFPVTARSATRRRWRAPDLGPTNGEMMKRGQQPASRPRKLYQAGSLDKRQANALPPRASSRFPTIYRFGGCTTGAENTPQTKSYSFTYTDIQDLANQCAAQQDIDGVGDTSALPVIFIIGSDGSCVTGVLASSADYPTIACDSSTVGRYFPPRNDQQR